MQWARVQHPLATPTSPVQLGACARHCLAGGARRREVLTQVGPLNAFQGDAADRKSWNRTLAAARRNDRLIGCYARCPYQTPVGLQTVTTCLRRHPMPCAGGARLVGIVKVSACHHAICAARTHESAEDRIISEQREPDWPLRRFVRIQEAVPSGQVRLDVSRGRLG